MDNSTGLRWGELIALRPRHLDLLHGALTVEETIVEVPLRAAPNGQRMITKPYPKDNEWRRIGLRPELLDQLTTHIRERGIGSDDLLFATRDGTPISRNTFRTRASWLLAGGSDLKSVMDRMGHTQIQTTQKYLHALPDTDKRNLDAFTRIAAQTE